MCVDVLESDEVDRAGDAERDDIWDAVADDDVGVTEAVDIEF